MAVLRRIDALNAIATCIGGVGNHAGLHGELKAWQEIASIGFGSDDLAIALKIDSMCGSLALTYSAALSALVSYLGLTPGNSILQNLNILLQYLAGNSTHTDTLTALNEISTLIGGIGNHNSEFSAWSEISMIGILIPSSAWVLETGFWNFGGMWTDTGNWNN